MTDRTMMLDEIPKHMHGAINGYIDYGTPPGDFLTAVFANNLLMSCALADDKNASKIFEYGRMLYFVPSGCKGSYRNIVEWIDKGGLEGKMENKT